jgi:hypothetical protein
MDRDGKERAGLRIVAVQAVFVGYLDDERGGLFVPRPDQGHVDEGPQDVPDQGTIAPDCIFGFREIGIAA